MTRAIIHVNRHLIAANARDGGSRPIYSVKRHGKVTYAHGVEIAGKITLIDPRVSKPLKCGARAWLEVDGEIDLIDPVSFASIEGSDRDQTGVGDDGNLCQIFEPDHVGDRLEAA